MTAGSEGSPVFDFTSLDFEGMERDLITYAQSRFDAEVWTDLNESNEGRRLIELLSYASDLLAYTINARILETIPASLIREQNFRNIAKGFDFRMKSASPSRTVLQFTLDPAFLPLTIPSNFKVADNLTGTVIFQPDVTGTALDELYTVSATQGEEIENEIIGISNGQPKQSYLLGRTSMIDDTLTVRVGGTNYRILRNIIEAGPKEKVCFIETFEDGTTAVRFGDGINGAVPTISSTIVVSYKIGGGLNVNFPKDSIRRLVSGLPGVLSVTNIVSAEGGGPKQSLTSAKRLLPLTIKENDRCVTPEDYAARTETIPGVLRASATPGLFQAGGNPIILFVVPEGGGAVMPSLSNLIVTTLRYGTQEGDFGRSLAGRRVQPRTPVYVALQVSADVYVQKGASATLTKARVKTAYQKRYSLEAVTFQDALSLQDAYNTVDPNEQKIDGLSRVFLKRFTVKPYCGRYVTRPSTGNGEALNIQTNINTQRREWNIQIIVGNRFYVFQRRLGVVSSISDHALEDEQSSYLDDELVTSTSGYRLRVREQEQSETFDIIANVGSSITVGGTSSPGKVSSLLVLATDRDTYAVERKESKVGKMLRTEVTGDLLQYGFVPVTSTNGFQVGDTVLLHYNDLEHVTTIASIPGGGAFLPATVPSWGIFAGVLVDWYWRSDDGTCGFALVQGDTPFAAGDEIYVDTFAQSGDIRLRPENYPKLDESDLVINTVGGVK